MTCAEVRANTTINQSSDSSTLYQVMLDTVQSHSAEVVVIDEIRDAKEVEAAKKPKTKASCFSRLLIVRVFVSLCTTDAVSACQCEFDSLRGRLAQQAHARLFCACCICLQSCHFALGEKNRLRLNGARRPASGSKTT